MRLLGFFTLLLFSAAAIHANENLACEDLAKATCEGIAQDNDKNFQLLAQSISNQFTMQLVQEQKNSQFMIQFFEKINQHLPPGCLSSAFDKMVCEKQTLETIQKESEQFHNWMLKKPSKFDDPNIKRPQFLLDSYNKIAYEQTKKSFTLDYTQEINRAHTMFNEVQKALIEKISVEVVSPTERQAMIDRLSTIKYDPELCMQNRDSRFYLNRSAYYQSRLHKFTICPKLFINPVTDAQLAFLIGHELSHSIDPCIASMNVSQDVGKKLPHFVNYQKNVQRIETYGFKLEMHPYSEQFKCLRKDTSSGVKIPAPHAENKQVTNQQFYDTLCDKDSITESFSDWMGTEAVAAVIYGRQMKKSATQNRGDFASTLSSKCLEFRESTDSHAVLNRRINGIIGVHPKIRQAMHCKNVDTENVYCPPPVANGKNVQPRPESNGVEK